MDWRGRLRVCTSLPSCRIQPGMRSKEETGCKLRARAGNGWPSQCYHIPELFRSPGILNSNLAPQVFLKVCYQAYFIQLLFPLIYKLLCYDIMLCYVCGIPLVFSLWILQMLDVVCSAGHVIKSHRLQSIRADNCQDQQNAIISFYREGKLDPLEFGRNLTEHYRFFDERGHKFYNIGDMTATNDFNHVNIIVFEIQKIMGILCT